MKAADQRAASVPLAGQTIQNCRQDAGSTLRLLSPAQRIVLRGIAEGKMTKEIAAELGVSESGVNYHKARIYKALNVTSNVEATRVYLQATVVSSS